MAFPVATPSRSLSGTPDRRRRAPRPRGGDNGTVALPSRLAALDGTGVRQEPGPRIPLDGALGSHNLYGHPLLTWTDWPANKRIATPIGYGNTRYVRRWVDNIVAALKFPPPQSGTTGWTLNSRTGGEVPMSPIPHGRRKITQTYRQQFDTRIQADYMPREQIQLPVGGRRYLKGSGAIMLSPYFPRLTRLAATTSYGQTTTVLTPTTTRALSHYSVGV